MDESMQLTSFFTPLISHYLIYCLHVEWSRPPLIFGGLPPVEMRGNRDGCSMYFMYFRRLQFLSRLYARGVYFVYTLYTTYSGEAEYTYKKPISLKLFIFGTILSR